METPLMKAVGFFDSAGTGPRAGRLRLATVTFVSVAIAIRCSIGFHPYSGMGTPPIFGDFEAQRHWMEITTALPAADWYRNTPENDLLYWGLDYPPLTAYHSYLCGRVLGWLEPGSMELHTSRGYETPTHKTHMRATVLFAELLTFFPAVFLFVSRFYRAMAERQKTCITLTVLLLPPLVLIDHGHFQYNAVSLGFHTLGLALLAGPGDRSEMRRYSGIVDAAATVAICLAVNYKQMCLYLVWPPFIYLLATNLRSERPFRGIVVLCAATIATFGVCWLPFLLAPQPLEAIGHVLSRQFPFGRGLYEDKVANVWCSLSLVLKLKTLLPADSLIKLCTLSTAAGLIPGTYLLARRPSVPNLLYGSVCSGLAFFLFSYQVHEKSILLPLLPAALLLGLEPLAASWLVSVAAFSMFPLLQKDGLSLAYTACMLGFNLLMAPHACSWRLVTWGHWLSILGMVAIHGVTASTAPPPRYPDLYTYVYAVYSCAHLLGFFCYFCVGQWVAALAPNTAESATCSDKKPAQNAHLRIAFIHPDLGIGGAERLVVDAAVGLQNSGHTIHMYTAHHDPSHCFEETRDGTLAVTVYGDWLPRAVCGRCMALCAYIRVFWTSARVLWLCHSQEQRFDALVVDQVSHAVPMLSLLSGAKVVFYCHYPDYLLTQRASCLKRAYRAPLDWAEEVTTGAADVVLVNSNFTAQTFAAAFPSLATRGMKPAVLYPAINLEQQGVPSGADAAPDADDLTFGGAKTVLLSINRFERKKNIALALHAVGALPEACRRPGELALVLAGGYDTRVIENVEVYAELEALAEKLGLSDILFLRRNISMVCKARMLQRACCLLYTPDKEHFGIVPVEAMYAQCPVLAVNSGGPLESILEGETGFLRPAEPKLWAEAIQVWLKSPSRRDSMGVAGRRRAVEQFSLDAFSQQLNDYITDAVVRDCVTTDALVDSASPTTSAITASSAAAAAGTVGRTRAEAPTGRKSSASTDQDAKPPRRSLRLRKKE